MTAPTAPTELTVELVPVDTLRGDPANPRRISDAELESLTRSLQQFGFVSPVVARREDRMVVGGHQRLVAARRLGYEAVPVAFVDLSLEQARLLNLALNRIHGEWDEESLAHLLASLQEAPDVDLSLSGFADDEVADYLSLLGARERRVQQEAFDLDAALKAAQGEPRTKPGDLFALGDHLLLCGDAAEVASYERLLRDDRAAMTFTDPPYNVDYGNHGGRRPGIRRRTIANDSMDAEAWETFVRAWAAHLLRFTDGAVYSCMSSKELPLLSRVFAELGGHWSDTLVWAKDAFTLGRADYQRQYEPIWYGWREGAKRQWAGGRKQGDIWEVDRPRTSELHPTMKPLELVERALENSSRRGDLVLDPFVGSGTTVIACERTGRRARAVELDPRYCDVVVARWETFTGRQAATVGEGA